MGLWGGGGRILNSRRINGGKHGADVKKPSGILACLAIGLLILSTAAATSIQSLSPVSAAPNQGAAEASSSPSSPSSSSSSSTTATSVSCNLGVIAVGLSSVCTVTVTGASPTGTVSFSQSSSNGGKLTFSSGTCTLSGGRCTFTVTGNTANQPFSTVGIFASYGGDANNLPSMGSLTVKVQACPCSMGIADYGTAGSYQSTEFFSWTNFTALDIGVSSVSSKNGQASLQLNLVDFNVGLNKNLGVYVVQDIMAIHQMGGGKFKVAPVNNVYNYTTSTAKMDVSSFQSNLEGKCLKSGVPAGGGYYFCIGKTVTVTLPFSIKLDVSNSGTCADNLVNCTDYIYFHYAIYEGGKFKTQGFFDGLAFKNTLGYNAVSQNPLGFKVAGPPYKYGVATDAENVLVGNGRYATVNITNVAATMSMYYFKCVPTPAYNCAFVPISSAYSYGAITAEKVTNVKMSASTTASGIPIGVASSGPDNAIKLWG